MIKPIAYQTLGLVLLFACTSPKNETREMVVEERDPTSLHWEKMAEVLMERIDVQPDEKVFFLAEPGRFNPLVDILMQRIRDEQGVFLGVFSSTEHQPDSWKTDFTEQARSLHSDRLQDHLAKADLGIMMPGPTPDDSIYHLMQENLWQGNGRTVHFHWSGAYDLSGNALEPNAKIDSLYQVSLLKTDYDSLEKMQSEFERAMRGKELRVTTPHGTDIRFEIGDRPVTKQDGDASRERSNGARNLIDREVELPAGAVRVAPIEETVNGLIAFPDAKWAEHKVEGLKLSFENGKVVRMEAKRGLEHVEQEIDQAGEAGKSFREFALGFNPTLAIPEKDPWIPYYGYGAGVVRLSLGDNTELGGQVDGGYVRWNFFPNATVIVGNEVWVEDGKLLK